MQGLAGDILKGVKEIADYRGETVRATYHHVAKGYLPVFRVGKIICARKSELNRALSAIAA